MGALKLGSDQTFFIVFNLITQAAAHLIANREFALVGAIIERQLQAKCKALCNVLKFTHIARPVVAQQQCALRRLQHVGRQAMAHAGLVGKILEQHQHVFTALTQGSNAQRCNIETVIQVGAEPPLVGRLTQVFLGGRNHANIQRNQLIATQTLNHPLLQHAQQFDLNIQAHAFYFIEEQGAAIGKLEFADTTLLRAGERARLMAEQFAFNHRLGQRTRVDRYKRSIAPARQIMQRPGDHFLA